MFAIVLCCLVFSYQQACQEMMNCHQFSQETQMSVIHAESGVFPPDTAEI